MYIKQIIIQGFKSYKDQVALEPFSPGTNVVVGRNGSGKSNFFAAIRFVLSDAYTSMAREERQGLLHEGTGSAVNIAYVEIIFDNSDSRFPTDNKEVIIRRTISAKKDEYSLDRKVVSKQDIVKLLETAGFSRSNPYYIVPQGRVTALTNMKESDRLNLLKEVAGTHVYEARRAESLKIMQDTNSKREKIDETLEYIKERLSELEEEKEELRGFQEKDRERRCLEYAYFHREQVTANQLLGDLESGRQGGVEELEENRQASIKGEKSLEKIEAEIRKLQQQLELLNKHHRDLVEDRRGASKTQAKVELKHREIQANHVSQEKSRVDHAAQMEQVKLQIAAKEKELESIEPNYVQQKAKETELRQERDNTQSSLDRLVAKQSRGNQFKTKAERDKFLQQEIEDLNQNLSHQKANMIDAHQDVAESTRNIEKLEGEIKTLRMRIENWGGNQGDLADELHKAEEILDKLHEERKELSRELDEKISIQDNVMRDKEKAERELSKSMDRMTSRGIETIERMKKEGLKGAYGTMAELMDVGEAYRLPVEMVAGGSLFHYVVDTAATATRIINHLNKTSGGRVTLVPLDKVHGKKTRFPRQDDALPLISKIGYDPIFEPAFQEVFGRTLLCQNLEKAAAYSAQHGIQCITMDGDTASKRGEMSGGYVDPRSSKLEAVGAVIRYRDEADGLENIIRDLDTQINIKNQQITGATGEVRKIEQKYDQVRNGFGPLQRELDMKTSLLEQTREHLEKNMKRQEAVDKNMKDFGAKVSEYEAELKSDFKKVLSAAEEKQMDSLNARLAELNKDWCEIYKSVRNLESRKKIIEADLRKNLQRQLDSLNAQQFETAVGDAGSSSIKEVERELKKAKKARKEIDAKIGDAEAKMENIESSIAKMQIQKAEAEQAQAELRRQIERQERRIEKQAEKKALLVQRADEAARNIRDLGVLPEEAFGKYERMDSKTIESRMKKVTVALKKYKHVNKKAFEQYNNFTTEQERLMNRRKELDESEKSIQALVSHLDRCKDEAIERTFKQVSREFASIFEKLVPAGHGRLVIQRKADRRTAPAEESEDDAGRGVVENYTGVGISVSFNSKVMDEQQKIQQLSGGQKSLCALCLIFALQATESSPMVIFDEVDANLDAQYRTAVADLLCSISQDAGTQFICTTFRPEIVHVADKCYGVTFHAKSSEINCVDREDALHFVEGQKR